MRRTLMAICLCLSFAMGWAQTEGRYDKGSVPVVNGRVMLQETLYTTLAPAESYERINQWAQQRFTKPKVIVSKFTSEDATNHTLSLTAEEYMVFANRFFVLDRTRINYWVEIQCTEQGATIKMTRINYWYEEEREGGLKFSAEEFITDEAAYNKKGKLLKDQGKFRRGTIDLFDSFVQEISNVLTR